MSMLAAGLSGLSTLKKKTSELLKGENTKWDSGQTNAFDAQHFEADSIGGASNGALLVHYKIQNDTDREGAVFVLPEGNASVTVAEVRACFPVPGHFHFRFKMPTPDNTFNGFAWVDLANDMQQVPLFKGHIAMKALRVPDEVQFCAHEPVHGSCFASAQTSLFGAQLDFNESPRQHDVIPPRRSPVASPPSCSPPDTPKVPGRATPPPAAPASPSPPPVPPTPTPGDFIEVLPTPSAPPGKPVPTKANSAHLPGDLIDCGLKMSSTHAKSVPSASPPYTSPSPPVPVKMPDRAQLVAEREQKERQRVQDTYNRHAEIRDKENQNKADKIQLSNKICTEMDQWARMPDGQAFKDIRTLLSTMHTVIWPNSGWQPLSLAEMVAKEANVKRYYRKAIILAHPDRHQDAEVETQVRADRIFQALNEAFKVAENS